MHRLLHRSLSIALLLLSVSTLAHAEASLFPFPAENDSAAVGDLVRRYLAYTEADPMMVDSIEHYAVDEFAKWLTERHGSPVRFPDRMPYRLVDTRAIRSDGSEAIVTVAVDADSVPMFGPLVIDWVFFAKKVEGEWRLSSLRRQGRLEEAVAELRYLDTSAYYPAALKPAIARESSRVLLSNAQLRRNFEENRERFTTLAGHFLRKDSLWMMGRVDRVVSQINQVAINWGDGAYEVPREAVDEFLARLKPEQRAEVKEAFRRTENQRRAGFDSVARIARRFGYTTKRVDSAVNLMRDLRVSFINSRLPWKGAVQFTVGGRMDDVTGYLYAPGGELPFISSEEYYYLEELGGGWWIFRAT